MKRASIKGRLRRFWQEWCKPILVIVAILSTFRSAVADWHDVPTGSMKPTILEGDRIVVNKLAYDLRVPFTSWTLAQWSEPQRGDIVICFSPETGTRLVKRVVGVPGDAVAMVQGQLIINGASVSYEPIDRALVQELPTGDRRLHVFATEDLAQRKHAVMVSRRRPRHRDFGPITVAADQFFVMGDNRDNSKDSRVFGTIPRHAVAGRVPAVAFSLDQSRWFLPRWHRFMRLLD